MYFAIGFISLICSGFGLSQANLVPLSDAQKQEFVDAHNAWRVKAGAAAMKKISWNNDLASFAEKVASRCSMAHSSTDERKNLAGFWYVGENMFATTGAVSPTQTVDSWGSETQYYNLDANTCSAPPNEACGHYTQVVWAETSDIGCGVAQCNPIQGWMAGQVVFCDYGVGGNVNGARPFEKGDPGSKCQQYNMVKENDGLCVKGGRRRR